MAGSGDALIAWTAKDGEADAVFLRRRYPGGYLGPIQRVTPARFDVDDAELAVNSAGQAVVVWTRALNGKRVVQARRRSAAGAYSAVAALSYAGADAEDPGVFIRQDGLVHVAWERRVSAGAGYVQARTLGTDGTLGTTQRLGVNGTGIADVQMADEVAAWTQVESGRRVVRSRGWKNGAGGDDLNVTQRHSSATADVVQGTLLVRSGMS